MKYNLDSQNGPLIEKDIIGDCELVFFDKESDIE